MDEVCFDTVRIARDFSGMDGHISAFLNFPALTQATVQVAGDAAQMWPVVRSGLVMAAALAINSSGEARAAFDSTGAYSDGFLAFILKDRVSAPSKLVVTPTSTEVRPAPQLASLPEPSVVAPLPHQSRTSSSHRDEIVPFAGPQAPGTIVVDTQARLLYLVQAGGKAARYHVAVGKPGAAWRGIEIVSEKRSWPDWTPTPEMRRRRPGLPSHMAGGPRNPLGARALYLGSSMYRIHGTTEPNSIGRAASSGCIRMLNDDVIDLYEKVPVGTRVEVL